MNLAEQIKSLNPAAPIPAAVLPPSWPPVFVRPLLIGDQESLRRMQHETKTNAGRDDVQPPELRAWLLQRSLCDETGKLIFAPADVAYLQTLSYDKSFRAILDQIAELNGWLDELKKKDATEN